jgi:crotonobetainyl-CoA:carnitine CoA-transferase CaiB-like acyl-CoA transferase
MKGALDGIRVVDWTQMIAGPWATGLLAALGADVIHVERLGVGDPMRGVLGWAGVDWRLAGGRNVPTEVFNQNKKSLAINLKTERGRGIIYRLVERSDVFVTSFNPSRVEEYGLGPDILKKYNPKLIYASTSLFGPEGLDSNVPGYDFLGQARSGVMSILGHTGGEPVPGPPNVSDQVTGIALGYGIVVALLSRERMGIVQQVHASQLGAMISILEQTALANVLLCGKEQDKFVRAERHNPLGNCYKCKDGRWIFITILFDRDVSLLAKMLNTPELEQDTRFSTFSAREENRHALITILDKAFSTKTAAEWQEIARRYNVPFAITQRLEDLETDPQVVANNYIMEYDHPELGRMKYPGFPFQLTETPASCRTPAPQIGQHTEEILIDVCGYDWSDIEALQEEGII